MPTTLSLLLYRRSADDGVRRRLQGAQAREAAAFKQIEERLLCHDAALDAVLEQVGILASFFIWDEEAERPEGGGRKALG